MGNTGGDHVAAATVLEPVFEPGTSKIRSKSAKCLTPTYDLLKS